MDLCSRENDERYPADYWVCEDGSRLYAVSPRRPDRFVKSRCVAEHLKHTAIVRANQIQFQGASSSPWSGWAATLICPITTCCSWASPPGRSRGPSCSPWRPSPPPATPRRWRSSVRSSTVRKPSHNLNCPKSLCHCIQPTYFSKPVGIQLTYFPNSFLTTDENVVWILTGISALQHSHSRPAGAEELGRDTEAQRGGGQQPPEGDPEEPGREHREHQGGDPRHQPPHQQAPHAEVSADSLSISHGQDLTFTLQGSEFPPLGSVIKV